MIQRGEFPRDMIGLVVRCRGGGNQPQMLRYDGQGRQQYQRIKGRDGSAPFERLHRHVKYGQVVGHEEGIESTQLQLLCKMFEMMKVEIGIRKGTRITPRRSMNTDRPHESSKSQS